MAGRSEERAEVSWLKCPPILNAQRQGYELAGKTVLRQDLRETAVSEKALDVCKQSR